MRAERGRPLEPLAALAALVGFEASMNSLMDVLLLVRREALIAE